MKNNQFKQYSQIIAENKEQNAKAIIAIADAIWHVKCFLKHGGHTGPNVLCTSKEINERDELFRVSNDALKTLEKTARQLIEVYKLDEYENYIE